MSCRRYNIVIIEPSEIILSGLKSIIGQSGIFNIKGTYSDILNFEEKNCCTEDVDLAIINPTLFSYSKRGAVRSLFPNARLVALLYNFIDKETLNQYDGSIEVYDKSSKVIHTLNQILNTDKPGKPGMDVGELSEREKEILIAVAKGMLNKEIADLYNISIHTVIAHRKNISRKTGIKSVSGFVVYALLNNLIEDHEVL